MNKDFSAHISALHFHCIVNDKDKYFDMFYKEMRDVDKVLIQRVSA
jgi:hypothetical protein